MVLFLILYIFYFVRVEQRLAQLKAAGVEGRVDEGSASHGTSSVSLPPIPSAQARPVSRGLEAGLVMESTGKA